MTYNNLIVNYFFSAAKIISFFLSGTKKLIFFIHYLDDTKILVILRY